MLSDDSKTGIRTILDRPNKHATGLSEDSEGESEYTAYAQGRVSRSSQLSVIFRMADGSARALAYSHLYSVESSQMALGFTMDFGQCKVRVTGRNLEMLFRLTCQYRVAEIREIDRASGLSLMPDAPVVQRIEILSSTTPLPRF